jgi:endonuclease/exonuclease/phosphatase family metal-dependent hydrolase
MRISIGSIFVLAAACGGGDDGATFDAEPPPTPDARLHFDPATSGCTVEEDYGWFLPDELFEYAWTCSGEVAPTGAALPPAPVDPVCPAGTWPDLATDDVCPTVSTITQVDPVSGMTLPPAGDDRALPLELAAQEGGSFRKGPPEPSYPARLKVVVWNAEYTAHLDDQIELLTTHPVLGDADVYLLNEVDRCSTRNGERRAAQLLAEAIGGDYVYAVEFVELDIDRDIGGDTGQAIVSRRPLTGTAVTCHSMQNDWFASEPEPRLGQRIRLSADIPAGDTSIRMTAVHLESVDAWGEKRVLQSREILDRAQAEACDRPQLVGGDFNAWYCTAPELEVMRKAGFMDAIRQAGDTGPTRDDTRIDFLWQRGVTVVEGGVIRDLMLSDHDPLWAVIEVE